MPKYRKKPVVIEAVQWDGTLKSAENLPTALGVDASVFALGETGGFTPSYTLGIDTLEGCLTVSPGDYIIRGVKGEVYPVKEDIFEMTYEAVAE